MGLWLKDVYFLFHLLFAPGKIGVLGMLRDLHAHTRPHLIVSKGVAVLWAALARAPARSRYVLSTFKMVLVVTPLTRDFSLSKLAAHMYMYVHVLF